MTGAEAAGAVVIGIGNDLRRDDGVGPVVARAVAARGGPGLRVLTCPAEPGAILDAWAGSALAVVVDAAVGGRPGRVRAGALDGGDWADRGPPVSSHDLGLRQTYELARLLGRAPATLALVTVDVGDTGHGPGLSPAVAAALPEAVGAVERLLAQQADKPGDQQP